MVKTYKVEFVWDGQGVNLGNLSQVRVDGQDLPPEPNARAAFVNWWLQVWHGEARRAGQLPSVAVKVDDPNSLTVTDKQCVVLPRGRFLYMDIGRWLNGNQDFGLVAGNNVYLCKYSTGAPPNSSPAANKNPEDELLGIPGVSVQDHAKILRNFPKDSSHLYLLLPDMHVPATPAPDEPDYYDIRNSPSWKTFEKYDCIFHSCASIPAMTEFLRKVRACGAASRTTLVQIGDMYELWAGRDHCYFQDLSDEDYINALAKNEPTIRLLDIPLNDGTSEPSAREIGDWIARTHSSHYDLFREFDLCNAELADCKFLYGNHDSYLAVPQVVDAANDQIPGYLRQFSPPTYGDPKGHSWSPLPTRAYYRVKELSLEGLVMEHGQRYDWPNRDGHKYGYDKTNEAVDSINQWKKAFDSDRHPTFIFGAAARWLLNRQNFGLFVQGHTHSPLLAYLEIGHVRVDYTWVPVGDDNVEQVETRTPM